jgi:hypothetical protein
MRKERMKRQLTPLIVLAAATFACSGEKPASAPPATSAPATLAPAAPAATLAPATTTAVEVGVPECDEFLRKYEACVTEHVPAASKVQFQDAITQWRKSWRDAAAQPAAKASLVATCKQAVETTRMATTAYGCKW